MTHTRALVSALLLLSGCASAAHPPPRSAKQSAAPTPALAPIDTTRHSRPPTLRETQLLRQLMRATERLRGLSFLRPIVMRVEGDDKAGLGGRVTQAWEMAGINLHGLVMSAVGGKFIGYATFDTVGDANKAATIMAELGTA